MIQMGNGPKGPDGLLFKDGGPRVSDPSEEKGNPRKVEPRKALAPLLGMVLFIIVTFTVALLVTPLYIRQGLQAFGEEGATNPLIAVYYLIMIIIVTGIILLLRKFLKRRKRNFLKYILAAAVLLSTYAVVSPVLDILVHGMPEEWEVQDLDIDDSRWALPIGAGVDHPSIMVAINDTLRLLGYEGGKYEKYSGQGSVDLAYPVALHNYTTESGVSFAYQVAVLMDDEVQMIHYWDGPNMPQDIDTPVPNGKLVLEENTTLLGATTIEDDRGGDMDLYLVREGWEVRVIGMDRNNRSVLYRTEDEISFSFGSKYPVAYFQRDIYTIAFHNGTLELEPAETMEGRIHWIRGFGHSYLICTEAGLHLWRPGGDEKHISDRVISYPYLVWLAENEDEWEVLAMKGHYLYVIDEGGHRTWGMDDYDYLTIYEDRPGGTLTVVSEQKIERGRLHETDIDLTVEVASFMLAFGVVVVLLWKPKWWIVDLSGILMGAGVLALIGISISLIPVLLMMVLLAVYDFISVYKTKHMLALADSVVESKLPILLVFPMRLGYKYEEERNLLDKDRPREAMFMGLGDVIIPGALVVSSFTFLPSDGIHLLGIIPPSLGVSLFTALGMLVGWCFLMYQVLKGKAHAGLPFLNSGAILGFLVGELIIYGSLLL